MVAMPNITTVWVVHLEQGNPLDTKGTLVLTDSQVAFSGEDGRETRISLERIRRVKRVLGSPIMIVDHDGDDGRRRTAFYFSQPPPLHPREDLTRMKRKRAKKASVGYLGQQNITRKPLIKSWVGEIEEAIGRLHGSAEAGPG
jgi:hypothetical protein